jgi:hypothetical protein
MRELPRKAVPGILSAPIQRMKMHGVDASMKVASAPSFQTDYVYYDADGNRVGSFGWYRGATIPALDKFPGAVRKVRVRRPVTENPGD